jgi:hypothetical protein
MKTITLEEQQSKFARILIAANTLTVDRFIAFQEQECKDVGAMMELRIMKQMATELGIKDEVTFSKWREFLVKICIAAHECKLILPKVGAYPGDEGATMGGGQY